jgi:hypothetical protein
MLPVRWADILVYGPDGQPQLVVEVKNRVAASPKWAAELRRNLAVHFGLDNAPYFLLALPDRFYFWKRPAELAAWLMVVEPGHVMEASAALAPFLPSGRDLETVTEAGLELLVAAWLQALIDAEPHADDGVDWWLRSSGLLDAVRGGTVKSQVLA